MRLQQPPPWLIAAVGALAGIIAGDGDVATPLRVIATVFSMATAALACTDFKKNPLSPIFGDVLLRQVVSGASLL
jgi:hypothetical protein